MRTRAVSIIGAGGHAKVVIDAVRLSHPDFRLTLYDNDPNKVGQSIMALSVLAWPGWEKVDENVHIAIGDNETRKALALKAQESGKSLLCIKHPASSIAQSAFIGDGVFLASGCVVAAESRIQTAVIINHNSVVDHDTSIGAFSHIAPGAILCGYCNVGESVLVGAKACVLPTIHVGNAATIGAGAVVTRNVSENSVSLGVPSEVRSA